MVHTGFFKNFFYRYCSLILFSQKKIEFYKKHFSTFCRKMINEKLIKNKFSFKMVTYENCVHDFIDKTCFKCGLMIDSCIDEKLDYTKNCPQLSSGKSNILDNLEDIPFDVISKAKSNITER